MYSVSLPLDFFPMFVSSLYPWSQNKSKVLRLRQVANVWFWNCWNCKYTSLCPKANKDLRRFLIAVSFGPDIYGYLCCQVAVSSLNLNAMWHARSWSEFEIINLPKPAEFVFEFFASWMEKWRKSELEVIFSVLSWKYLVGKKLVCFYSDVVSNRLFANVFATKCYIAKYCYSSVHRHCSWSIQYMYITWSHVLFSERIFISEIF